MDDSEELVGWNEKIEFDGTLEIILTHDGLDKYRRVRGRDHVHVKSMAKAQIAQWDKVWNKKETQEHNQTRIKEKREEAKKRTSQAQKDLMLLKNLLSSSLKNHLSFDWDHLKQREPFAKQKPVPQNKLEIPEEPQEKEKAFQPRLSLIDRLFSSLATRKIDESRKRFRYAYEEWEKKAKKVRQHNKQVCQEYEKVIELWNQEKNKYHKFQDDLNQSVDKMKQAYSNRELIGIEYYFNQILEVSKYPSYFPKKFEIQYLPNTKTLIVDYSLLQPDALPALKAVNYIQTRQEFTKTYLSKTESGKLYDNVLYQIALRTVHELHLADKDKLLGGIVFNGCVMSIDKGTGRETNACILSLQVTVDEIEQINLELVEPKICFRKLKGVSSSKLHGLAPVAPIMQINKKDSRFVSSYDVSDGILEGENIAAMDWEDFEHLVRELFESEFESRGAEVKVTQASRDGGVDAVIFDSDPITGGKIILQAKRYTNTVGVSAVRDLYGTVVNEGANKGILITTSNYGPDAYKFAKGKPITLLDGSNLLHMMEKHGHKVRIDLKEAKQILKEREEE